MKLKRNVTVDIATEYNDLANYVNNKRTVIFIQGPLYDEMTDKANSSKMSKNNKLLGAIVVVGGILTGDTLAIILGAISLATGLLPDDFKDYKVKINKKSQRIELYLNKGENKYDSNYDTLVIPK